MKISKGSPKSIHAVHKICSNEKAHGHQPGVKSSKDDDKDQNDQLDAFTEDVESTHTLGKERQSES